MKHPRLALWTLAAVHLLLFILLPLCWKPWAYSSWITYSCLAIFFSQGYLLGLWAAIGGKPSPWRASFVVIVASILVWFTHQRLNYLLTGLATITVTGQSFQVMGIFLLARFMGLGLNQVEAEDHLSHLQFSIGQALSWMTAFAVFMGATRYLWSYFVWYSGLLSFRVPASCLAVALATTWLILGDRLTIIRCFTLLVMVGFGTAWIAQVVQPFDPWWHCAIMLVCEAAVVAASLVVVRLAGYRLMWHWHFRRPKA